MFVQIERNTHMHIMLPDVPFLYHFLRHCKILQTLSFYAQPFFENKIFKQICLCITYLA